MKEKRKKRKPKKKWLYNHRTGSDAPKRMTAIDTASLDTYTRKGDKQGKGNSSRSKGQIKPQPSFSARITGRYHSSPLPCLWQKLKVHEEALEARYS